jgi:adenine specific DNA methylase Mod
MREWIKASGNPVDKEDLQRHDKWLSMMWPRLQLLKELLSYRGAIFISIDDNEMHRLRLLIDDTFGEDNFVTSFIWEKRTTRENRRAFSVNHDYVLCYALSKAVFEEHRGELPLSDEVHERYQNPDNDVRGEWQSISLNAQAGHATSEQFYEITLPSGRVLNPPEGRCWTVTKARGLM